MPGLSSISMADSCSSAASLPNRTHISCLVTPGKFRLLAMVFPSNLLIKALFPTFGNPMMAHLVARGLIPRLALLSLATTPALSTSLRKPNIPWPNFPSIKVGSKDSFRDVLTFLGYKPTSSYLSDDERPSKYSLSSTLNVLPTNSHYAKDVKNRRKLKRAFMFCANHEFFKNQVYPVFWYGWTRSIDPEKAPEILIKAIEKRKKGRTSYETSAVGYLDPIPEQTDSLPQCTAFGFEIQGRVTYAVDHDAWSNEKGKAHKRVKAFYANSGLDTEESVKAYNQETDVTRVPIRPSALPFPAWSVCLDNPRRDDPSRSIIGEVIVDDFAAVAVVINLNWFASMLGRNPSAENREILIDLLDEIEDHGTCKGMPVKTIGDMAYLRSSALKRESLI